MGTPQITPEALRLIVGQMVILILSICVHEFGHAFVADKLGDDTPARQGRVTLNPFAHADPIGTLALPAIALFLSSGRSMGFGWGKPVMTNPVRYTRRFSMRVGQMFVGFAGPAMNIVFGTLIAAVMVTLIKTGTVSRADFGDMDKPWYMLNWAIILNYALFFFNLIPSPPLDGGHVIQGLLPRRLLPGYQEIARYGIFILMAFMLSPTLGRVIWWPATHLYHLVVYTIFGL
jgi:Zn-dependent protease